MWKNRFTYGLILLAMILFIIFLKEYLSFFVLIFFLILPVISLLLLLIEKNQVELEFQLFHSIVKRKEQATLQLSVKNRWAFLPIPVRITLQVENQLFQETSQETLLLPAGRKTQVLQQPISSTHCGRISVHIREVRIYDPLRLFYFRKKQLPERRFFLVMPTIVPLSLEVGPQLEENVESDRFSTKKPGDDPAQVFEIRPYHPGDRVHRIHWKLSSKMDELMVKEYSLPIASRILFLVAGTPLKMLDDMMDIVTSMLNFCQQNELEYSFAWYEENKGPVFVPISDEENLTVTLSCLFSVKEQKGKSLLEQMGNGGNGISHLLYLCGQPDLKLMEQFSEIAPNIRRTVLQVDNETVKELPTEWERILVNPSQLETSLLQLLL